MQLVKHEDKLIDSDQESSLHQGGMPPDYGDEFDNGSFVDEEVAGNESDVAYADSDG